MVEANIETAPSRVTYAKWREDIPAQAGYSPELISKHISAEHFDNLD